MSSFFEKLKKGMDIKDLPEAEEDNNFSVRQLTEAASQKAEPEKEEKDLPKDKPFLKTKILQSDSEKKSAAKKTNKKSSSKKKRKEEKNREKTAKTSSKSRKIKKEEEKTKTKLSALRNEEYSLPKEKNKPLAAAEAAEEERIEKGEIPSGRSLKKEKVGAVEGKKGKRNWFEPKGQLVVDVYETNGEVVIQSAIAGVRPENLDISIENDVVVIKGRRDNPAEKEKPNYFYQECYWGAFSREIILPVEVNSGKIRAEMKNGILEIRIPKIERTGKKKVIIE